MILITGASSGIGEACARLLAKGGNDLILVARRRERLKKLAETLSRKYQIKVHAFALDLSDSASITAFLQANAPLIKQVTVLINNAGLARGLSTFQEGDPDDWDAMFDVNVRGLLRLTRGILPAMIARKEGHIVTMGSVAGYWVYPRGNIYCATKYAVRAITEALRMDLSGTGVRVTEISPGMVETEFSQVRLQDAKKAAAVYAGMTPLKAQDIAEAVKWSLDRPAHVNIQQIVIYPTQQAAPSIVHRTGG